LPRFRASLEALVNTVLSCELHCAVELDLTCALKLTLVADKVDSDVLSRVLLDLLQPTAKILKSLIARNVIGQENAVCTTVENPRHRFERLLARGVPDLKLDDLTIDKKAVAAKLDSNCDLVLLLEFVIHDTLHEAGLAYTSVADDDQLVEVILGWQRLVCQNLEGNGFDLLHLALLHCLSLFVSLLLFGSG